MSTPPRTSEPPEALASADGVVGRLRKDKLRAALFDEPVPLRRLGRYRVVGTLGRGGMGTVLEAFDDALERRVALKLLHRDVSPRDQGRLLREARALARLSHPNVVQVHEVGEEPRPFIAMELVHGRTLAQWQRERPPWRACVRAYLQAGRGLAAVHAQQMVHRDFKPSNCIIDDEGRVRVMDFGLARALRPVVASEDAGADDDEGAERTTSPVNERSPLDVTLTGEGVVIGTLAYMSLEQLEGRETDARSDQFGFCVALYEALYGERPFEGRSITSLGDAIREGRVLPPPPDSRVPLALRRTLVRGLAADPAQRWPSMHALLDALERRVRPRWRGRLVVVTVVGALALTAASVWHDVTAAEPCLGIEDQLVDIWDPSRREQLRQALLASPLPYARSAWEGIEPRLDSYASAWVETSRDVCEEARVRRQQPESVVALRTACLHERRVALREAIEVLVSAEPAVVERAVGLVSQLPRLERCDDVSGLLAAVPAPSDAELGARVQALRDELIEARALRIAGRYSDSLGVVERVAQEAQSIDYPPLHAELQLARGWALYGEGRNDEAVTAFEDAYALATAHGHDAVASDATAMLTFIVGERQSKHEVGLRWAVTARAHAMRPGVEPGAEATALSNEAAVHLQRGDFAQARSSYERAIALQQQAFGPDDVRLAFTYNGLGVVHTSLDELDEAEACHQRAFALRRDNLGPNHPHVAMSLNNLGVVADRRGHYTEARGYVGEALAIKERILGPDHPELVSSLINLGAMMSRDRSYAEARRMFERAIAITERSDGPTAVLLGPALHGLGVMEREQGLLDRADATLLRAQAIMERAYGPDHPELIPLLVNLAEVKQRSGDPAAGILLADRAQVIAEHSLPADSQMRGDPLMAKGRIELELGHASAALGLAEEAQRLWERADGPLFKRSMARFVRAKALAALDPPRPDEAALQAERAMHELETMTDSRSKQLRDEIAAWLESLKRRRDPPR